MNHYRCSKTQKFRKVKEVQVSLQDEWKWRSFPPERADTKPPSAPVIKLSQTFIFIDIY